MIQGELLIESVYFLYSGDATAIRVKPHFLRNTRQEDLQICQLFKLLSVWPVAQLPVIVFGEYPAEQQPGLHL